MTIRKTVQVNAGANVRAIRAGADRIKNLLAMYKTSGDSNRRDELLKKIKVQSDSISQEIGGSPPVSRRLRMLHKSV